MMNMGGMVSQVHVPNAVMHLTMGVIDMAAGFLHSVSLKTFPQTHHTSEPLTA